MQSEHTVQLYNMSGRASNSWTWHNLTSLPAGAGRAYHGCALLSPSLLVVAGGRDTATSQHLKSAWALVNRINIVPS